MGDDITVSESSSIVTNAIGTTSMGDDITASESSYWHFNETAWTACPNCVYSGHMHCGIQVEKEKE